MKYREIIEQVFLHISGHDPDKAKELMDVFIERFPEPHKLDKDIPDDRAEKMISELLKEDSGILAWAVRGAVKISKNSGNA